MRKLSCKYVGRIESRVKLLLHAGRDRMRNQVKDWRNSEFDLNQNTYYFEAFGIMQGLQALGYGEFGAVNDAPELPNLCAWFDKLKDDVLKEENFGGSNHCDFCLNKYGKDGIRKKTR